MTYIILWLCLPLLELFVCRLLNLILLTSFLFLSCDYKPYNMLRSYRWTDLVLGFLVSHLCFFFPLQYWVSQGNKWCDFCKIYISNNPSSIRNHDLGQRHKENVQKKLADMRKENAAKEKEHKETARALEQIEAVSVFLAHFSFKMVVLC